jgi:transcriptional regulator with XRE-family HTH domain
MTIGEKLKAIRKEKNLTQKALGNLCGLSESMIRQYELGLRNPKYAAIGRIAGALDVEIHQLVDFESADQVDEAMREIKIDDHIFKGESSREYMDFLVKLLRVMHNKKYLIDDSVYVSALNEMNAPPEKLLHDIESYFDYLIHKYKITILGG